MTNESKGQTEAFIESTQARYAYAYDKGGKVQRWFGVSGIPHGVLLDPNGRVVWRGHPGQLTSADIEPALKGALQTPLYSFGKEAEKVKKALAKGKWSDALAEAAELGEAGKDLQLSLAALVQLRADALDEAWAKGDYRVAEKLAEGNADDLAGLPQGDRAKELLDDLKGDKEKKKILKAQEKVVSLLEDPPTKDKDFDKLYKKLDDIVEDHPGTAAAADAEAAKSRMRQRQAMLKQH